jgi:hypothetical protein
MPWWVRAAGERHVVLALLVAGLLVAWPAWWLEAASPVRTGVLALAGMVERLGEAPLLAALSAPWVALALALALAPVALWATYELARAIERRTLRVALGRLS